MRRSRLSGFLFALALAVQAFAPVAATIAMARNSSDSVEICLQAGRTSPAGQNQLPRHDHQRHACPLCQACCGGVAPLEARPSIAGMAPVQWAALAWTAADRALPAPRREHAHQARAPPFFS